MNKDNHTQLVSALTTIISETNGLSLSDTIDLLLSSDLQSSHPQAYDQVHEFRDLLNRFQINQISISALLKHPVSAALFEFFKNFPLKYNEEHIHLTGAISAEFIYPRLMKLLQGPDKKVYEEKIAEVYGADALPIR
ncbi:MAG TPA: hypothetical protein VN132_00690, partial [Bdellovibrio sp.]|nr:hypothetical protein [Bdellovibrio sp.]